MKKIEKFEDLVGETLIGIQQGGDEVHFTLSDGRRFKLYHEQDCCESVYLEDVTGVLDNLVGSPILLAEEVSNYDGPTPPRDQVDSYSNSYTWTFYKIATLQDFVTLRWFGTSNGYYSERADFGPA